MESALENTMENAIEKTMENALGNDANTLEIVNIDPKQPFVSPDGNGYFCNSCKQYSVKFTPSFIKRQYRVCSDCYNEKRKVVRSKAKQLAGVPLLRHKLYRTFYGRNQRQIAKAVTDKTITKILKLHNTSVDKVQRILPPKEELDCQDLTKYSCVVNCS